MVDFYIPDYGLENCTLSLRRAPNGGFGMPDNTTGSIDVYMVHDAEVGIDPAATYLDTLSYISEQESTSRAFHCPSRSHVVFEWRCLTKDCVVYMPLEGVTSRSELIGTCLLLVSQLTANEQRLRGRRSRRRGSESPSTKRCTVSPTKITVVGRKCQLVTHSLR